MKPDEELKALLRDHDLADSLELPSVGEIDRVRRSVLAEVADPGRRAFGSLRLVYGVAAVIIILTIGSYLVSHRGVRDGESHAAGLVATTLETTGAKDTENAPKVRRIEMSTPGGTRIVWALDPDFEL